MLYYFTSLDDLNAIMLNGRVLPQIGLQALKIAAEQSIPYETAMARLVRTQNLSVRLGSLEKHIAEAERWLILSSDIDRVYLSVFPAMDFQNGNLAILGFNDPPKVRKVSEGIYRVQEIGVEHLVKIYAQEWEQAILMLEEMDDCPYQGSVFSFYRLEQLQSFRRRNLLETGTATNVSSLQKQSFSRSFQVQ